MHKLEFGRKRKPACWLWTDSVVKWLKHKAHVHEPVDAWAGKETHYDAFTVSCKSHDCDGNRHLTTFDPLYGCTDKLRKWGLHPSPFKSLDALIRLTLQPVVCRKMLENRSVSKVMAVCFVRM